MSHSCNIGSVAVGGEQLALIAGPCVAESLDLCLSIARTLSETCRRLGVGYVFKASVSGFRGPGMEQGLAWLEQVRREVGCPVLTDVHEVAQVAPTAAVVDCLQIPAFLCRQTDLLIESGRLAKCVNVKKGQFMSPWEMEQAVNKVRSSGCQQVLLTERGTFFGYNRLVNDFRALPQMRAWAPVVFDATHSVQEPGGLGTASGGQRQVAPLLAGAAMAVGVDALFLETHPEPSAAKSDAAVMLPLSDVEEVLKRCLAIRAVASM